jgi:hypothetical protein
VTQEAAVPPEMHAQMRRIAREEAAAFYRSGAARSMSISGGALTVRNGGKLRVLYPDDQGGGLGVYFGDIVSEGSGTYLGTGLLVQQPDGSDMATFRSDAITGETRAEMYGSDGSIIVGNDAVSGSGLARPYVGSGFGRHRYADMTVSTASDTFETLWNTTVYKQHPILEVAVRATMDTSGTTGEVRVMADGVQIGATSSEGFAIAYKYFNGPLPGDHMEGTFVEIQGRRTSPTGALRVEPRYWLGRQS